MLDDTIWPIEPHTTLKHLAYKVYLQCWMAKILTRFPQATIVDAFAGPGEYTKGQQGSPIVAASTYLNHSRRAKFGRLSILCSEDREDRVRHLKLQINKLERSPNLTVEVLEPGPFSDRLPELLSVTGHNAGQPVLWIVDPFNITPVGISEFDKCLRGARHELILTFFVDEMYRFAEKNPNMAPALDRQYGNNTWRKALGIGGEGARKEAFNNLFRSALQEQCNVLTSSFGISVKNASSRYDLVFATHSDKGLECWNQMTWRIDTLTGRRSSAADAEQPSLFTPDTGELENALLERSGYELPWSELIATTIRMRFKETHLRRALTELNERGLAFRTSPIDAPTPWPAGSTVQIHGPDEFD